MGRRIPRDRRPCLEEVERRELLSAITDVMAGNSISRRGPPFPGRGLAATQAGSAVPPSRSPSRRIKARC